jgi:aerobic C4-dicarboxylate transport protein
MQYRPELIPIRREGGTLPGECMAKRRPWYKLLYVQVLIAIVIGVIIGYVSPKTGTALKPLGDAFIALIRMMIGPLVFCVVVQGIASMGDLKKVGRIGAKALIYFEVVSTFALITGLAVGLLFRPGDGFNINPATLNAGVISKFVSQTKHVGAIPFLLSIIPHTFVGAFTSGDVLQVLLLAILFGFALTRMGKAGEWLLTLITSLTKVMFGIIHIIILAAPIGALGGMAFTVGSYGFGSLSNLFELIGTFYATAILFIALVLGPISYFAGFSILRFLIYIKDELLIVLGTSSSETVLPDMMLKLERLGVSRETVGLVFPTGYSFNTDGANIYITLCVVFLAQATNTHLSFGQLATLLLVAALSSKGGAGVTGTSFVTLAATLVAVPDIPVASLAIIIGIDKFMSECRALTNIVGNGVATIVVSKWEGELEGEKMAEMRAIMSHRAVPAAESPQPSVAPEST